MGSKKNALEELQNRKAELALKCKAKGEEINQQADYITGHLGEIAIKSIIGERLKKSTETKTGIIRLLVSESIDAAVSIKKDPTHIKDKLVDFGKKAGIGLLDLLFK